MSTLQALAATSQKTLCPCPVLFHRVWTDASILPGTPMPGPLAAGTAREGLPAAAQRQAQQRGGILSFELFWCVAGQP